MSLINRKSVRCDARLTKAGGSTACRGWVGAVATTREARRVAKADNWQHITDPDEPGTMIDVCPPCAFERKRNAQARAEAELLATVAVKPEENRTP